ncbi:ABC transporter substrate-binding protein [Xenorhabdus bovienii]|uniref:ABC transporter substrate-binding protein n=1 Tax=Xenorhabdus bovienii TaxID=40576 RepID=UPI0023B20A70|nr:ABC transporter substrate-binding protein [Xenorhabdus bovienii]
MSNNSVLEETKSLSQLYDEAIDEGGELTVYAGGDTIDQQDDNAKVFRKIFPKINLHMIVDYSKFHNARIDLQLQNNTLKPDVVQLQVLHDFPRWKDEGHLLEYKPAGFSKIYHTFRDIDAAWIGISVNAFAYLYNVNLVDKPPTSASDYLDNLWRNNISVNYPNDDDATQFFFMKNIEKYGWNWLSRFLEQHPNFLRGGQAAIEEVISGKKALAFGVFGPLEQPHGDSTKFLLPDTDPFMAWAQRAAIFKQAKHPIAAKLYLNWWLSTEQQIHWHQWSVRTDIPPKAGYKPIWEYCNVDLEGFVEAMMDRGLMERFRAQLTQYIGEAKGLPSAGILGLYPETGH